MELMNQAVDENSKIYATSPEPGQLVEVRRRQWVVADVVSSQLLQPLLVAYTDEERTIHQKLDEYCASREKSAAQNGDAFGTAFTNRLLKKRLFSSPAAFASTLEKHIATLSGDITRQKRDAMGERILYKAILKVEEDYANDQDYDQGFEETWRSTGYREI
jgi:hypothetical protein